MKKIISILALMLTCAINMNAMSYEQARREALFLTDKMAYELNLTDEQYDAAYEINLDYLMGVTSVDDVYGTYWTRRNLDMSYILLDAQWRAFTAATYFYRPLYWSGGYWHFGIYARYPVRTYFYFGHPSVYLHYRGGHCWTHYGTGSYYHGRRGHYHRGDGHIGMRDRWNNHGGRHHEVGRRPHDNNRPSGNVGNNNRPGNNGNSSRPGNNGNNNRPSTSGNTVTGNMGRYQDRHIDRSTVSSNSFNRYRTNSSTRITVNQNNNSSTTLSAPNRTGSTYNGNTGSSLRSNNIQSNMRSVSSSPVRSSGSSISRSSIGSSIRSAGSPGSSISRSSMGSSIRSAGSTGGSISRSSMGSSMRSAGSTGGGSHGGGGSHFRGAR